MFTPSLTWQVLWVMGPHYKQGLVLMCNIKEVFWLQACADLWIYIIVGTGWAESRSFLICVSLFLFLNLSPSSIISFPHCFSLSPSLSLTVSASHQSQLCLLSMKYLVQEGLCAQIANFISPWNNRWYVCVVCLRLLLGMNFKLCFVHQWLRLDWV